MQSPIKRKNSVIRRSRRALRIRVVSASVIVIVLCSVVMGLLAESPGRGPKETKKGITGIMTAKIIWIVAGALATVGAMIWFSKMVESKDESSGSREPEK